MNENKTNENSGLDTAKGNLGKKIVADISRPIKKTEEYWEMLGPGLTTGAADDDCSGVATYSQTGAKYGFQLLWLAAFTFPLMAIVQEMCARIGLVTGRGLASNIRRHYPKWVLYISAILLFAANSFNIGADLGAMAKVTQLLFPKFGTTFLLLFFSAFCLSLQIFSSYKKYAKYLKWLSLILLSYVLSALLVKLDWGLVLWHAVIPSFSFSKEQILLITAVLGTTISPYLFFWQSSQEVEEQILEGKTTIKSREAETSKKEVKKMRVDIWSGMFLSNVVMFFIIAASAATLYQNGITNINTAADAAEALRPLAGNYVYLLFTVGIIGVGLLAVPVLAGSASYALSESFGWREGLFLRFKQAHAFYGVIIISMLVGLAVNFLGLDAIKTLIYAAVFNGVIAPVILVLILGLSNNKKVMGEWSNKPVVNFFGWLVIGLMSLASLGTIVSLFL